MSVLKVNIDGGAKGNPGPASIGVVFYLNNKKIFQHHSSIGIATNNDAEYQALIYSLEEIKNQKEKLISGVFTLVIKVIKKFNRKSYQKKEDISGINR